MTCSWWWFIHQETAISKKRNGSSTPCVFKTHYRDRRATVANHLIFMQIQFWDHTTSYPDSGQQQSTEHALGVLGDGKVIVTVNDGQQQFDLSRTAQDDEPEADLTDDSPFVFSQSEIETIGRHAHSRLRLIDDFVQSEASRKASELPLVSKIRSSTAEIKALLAEIDDIKEKTASLPKLLAELERARRSTKSAEDPFR